MATRKQYVSISAFRSSAELLALNLPAMTAEGRAAAMAELTALADKLQKPQPNRRALAILAQLRDEVIRLDQGGDASPAEIIAAVAAEPELDAIVADQLEQILADAGEPSAEPEPSAAFLAATDASDKLAAHTASGQRSRRPKASPEARDAAKAARSEQAATKRKERQAEAKPEPAPVRKGYKLCAGLPTRGVAAHEQQLAKFGRNARMADGLSRVCNDCNRRYTELRKEQEAASAA